MSIGTYDSNDVIDLEHAFDEDRMSHYAPSNNRGFKPHRISLQSVDDDVLKSLTRSLITPLPHTGYPNNCDNIEDEVEDYRWNHHYQHYPIDNRPESRTESVMLFKNIDNGNEPATVDFVSSDLNEFMDPFADDDLMSRPPSRMPLKRRDSLNGFLNSSLLEKPSFAKPRSKERNNNNVQHSLLNNDYRQTNKENRRRLDPLHADSYTESVIQPSSKKDNYQLEESSMRSLRSKASIHHMLSSTKKLIEKEQEEQHLTINSNNRKKMVDTRNNDPEKLRKRYSFNHVDHSIVPENRRRPINNMVKESDKAIRRWSNYTSDQLEQVEADYKPYSNKVTDSNYKTNPRLLTRQQQQQQQENNRTSMELNYPNFNSEEDDGEEVDRLWSSQVTNDLPTPPSSIKRASYHYQQQRPVRITSSHQNTTINERNDNNVINPQRNRTYSNPTKYTAPSTEKYTTTGIPKRTSSKLYELATQKKQQTIEKPSHNVIPTVILSSRSSGELSNSTESSSNSGDLYYDPPSYPPAPQQQNRDRVTFISNRTRELSIRENREPLNSRGYRTRTLSEERETTRNTSQMTARSKKLSLDSQRGAEKPSVTESARQVLEMVRQRRQQAMASRIR